MIRRTIFHDGAEHWLRIPQPAHAGLSGALAAAWQAPIVSYSPAVDEVRQAILHHDDGWADWERAPELDPESGVPYSFTELPRRRALELWNGSIAAAAALGPLAGSAVAGHFLKLLETSEDASEPFALAWRDRNSALRDDLLERYAADHPDVDIRALGDEALAAVRAFDWHSLWLCCYGPLDAAGLDAAGLATPVKPLTTEDHVTFTPNTIGPDKAVVVSVDPWPLGDVKLTVDIGAFWTPADHYASTEALLTASRPTRIRWRFEPPAGQEAG